MMRQKRTESASDTQKKVERLVLESLSIELNANLTGGRLRTGRSYIEVDGIWLSKPESRAVAVEVFAHIGRVKAAQRHKVQTDVFKLSLARQILIDDGFSEIHCIVAFVCEECSKAVTGKTWVGDAANQLGVVPKIVMIPDILRTELLAAQALQNLLNNPEP